MRGRGEIQIRAHAVLTPWMLKLAHPLFLSLLARVILPAMMLEYWIMRRVKMDRVAV